MSDETSSTERRRLPAWALGFLIAVIVFVVVLAVSSLIGVGDDPVIEGLGLMVPVSG